MNKRKSPVKLSRTSRPRERDALQAYGHSLRGLADAKERLETIQFQLETLLLTLQKHLGSAGAQKKMAEACIGTLAQSHEYWRRAVNRASEIARKRLLAWLDSRGARGASHDLRKAQRA